jgi:acyl-CoA thioesterase
VAILDTLGNFANQIKSVTLPGVVIAGAFALLVWPPAPKDRVVVPEDQFAGLGSKVSRPIHWPPEGDDPLNLFALEGKPACDVQTSQELSHSSTVAGMKVDAVNNQVLLEKAHSAFQKCFEEETSLDGLEDVAIANLDDLITKQTAIRTAFYTQYQQYATTLSPLAEGFMNKVKEQDAEIQKLQAAELNYKNVKKDRARRMAELTRLDQVVLARLAEPGRLRPRQNFDDILSGLSNHVVGLLTLVLAWSLLIDPVNRAIFSYAYDSNFDGMWDALRSSRITNPTLQRAAEQNRGEHPGPDYALAKLILIGALALIVIIIAITRDGPTGSGIAMRCVILMGCACLVAYYWPKVLLDLRSIRSVDARLEERAPLKKPPETAAEAKPSEHPRQSSSKTNGADRGELGSTIGQLISFTNKKASTAENKIAEAVNGEDSSAIPLPDVAGDVDAKSHWTVVKDSANTIELELKQSKADPKSSTVDKSKSGDMSKCEKKMQDVWQKLSQPQYAIGLKIIALSDYQTLQATFYSDSQLSAGLILPVVILVWALLYLRTFEIPSWLLYMVLGAVETTLVLTAVDRRHKFETASDNLIAGAFMANCKANKSSKAGESADDVGKQIDAALSRAKIIHVSGLEILPQAAPSPPPPACCAAGTKPAGGN